MLLSSRPEPRWAIVLLLSIYAPWAAADEKPKTKPRSKIQAVSAEDVPTSPEAAERWRRLKSRYEARTDEERPSAARLAPASNSLSRKGATIRPIPDDEPEMLRNGDPAEEDVDWDVIETPRAVKPTAARPSRIDDDPLPISKVNEEPAWIYGTTAEAVDIADEEEQTPQDEVDAAPEPTPDESESTATKPFITEEPAPKDPGYARPSGSRRPRTIHEISPTYDRTSDQDIREFAREQMRQYNIQVGGGVFPQRMFPGMVYQWEASNLYHYPLYFQDPALERYGHTYGDVVQPVASIVRFGVQTVGLPYQMAIDPITHRQYALGWYRPGEYAPKLHYQVPLNLKAAAVEAAVITGIFYAIP
jgi:hypothetical protein